ncbi:PQQ-dependent sugar dehydrogenase [Saliphagus sp. GCM10025334]
MSEQPGDERPTRPYDSAGTENSRWWPTTRRRLLQATAAAGGFAAVGNTTLAQESELIELGGETSGWQGIAPDALEGETNPTLELEEGATYELTWENLDGQAHNIVIVDGDGEELERTELLAEEGETQTLEFEATSEMAEYYCEPHAGTMRGEVSIGGETDDETGDESEDGEVPAFFDPGVEIGLQSVAEGLTAPTDFAVIGGGQDQDQDQYLVADQTGELWLVDGDGRREEPFLDVSDRLVELGTFEGSYADPNQDYDERGLLGVEVHPNFAENCRFFVHYSAPPNDETADGWSHVEVISEFHASSDRSEGDPDSETVLLEFQKPQYNHDAGPMAFGPDGYLYVPMGDGGGANDDMEGHLEDWYDENAGGNGQNVTDTLLGGIHRIDVDAEGDDKPYAVPDDNPLVDVDDAIDEYYAWGFRNPFGISFDSDGRLFVSDAGQDLYEEANLVEAGGNYGWNVKEGTHCFSTDSPSDPPADCPDAAPDEPPYNGQELQDPIVEYPHVYEGETVGITIIGGHVYEADQLEELQGKYVFGDWTADPARQAPAGRLLAASEPIDGDSDDNGGSEDDGSSDDDETTDTNSSDDADGEEDVEAIPRDELWEMEELQVSGTDDGSFPYFVRQFGQDGDGNVYVLANREGVPSGDTGVVMKIVSPDEGDDISVPDDGADEQEADEEATEDTQDEPIDEDEEEGEGADDNETDGNESDDET